MQLVIDTATEVCSVAMIEGEKVIAERHEEIGRGHAERLLPMIAELPDGGRADTVLVDCGPGSFTGVRVGIAAARALGLAWQADVTGYSSLALIAAMALAKRSALDTVAVAIPAGHGEVFLQHFTAAPFAERTAIASLPPQEAARQVDAPLIAGKAARDLASLGARGEVVELLPRAADSIRLPDAFRQRPAQPIYGRAPDAKPMQ